MTSYTIDFQTPCVRNDSNLSMLDDHRGMATNLELMGNQAE